MREFNVTVAGMAFVMATAAPEKKRIMLPVSQTVYDRYKKFWETLEKQAKPDVKLEKIGEDMRREWGGTYWWYNIFGRKLL